MIMGNRWKFGVGLAIVLIKFDIVNGTSELTFKPKGNFDRSLVTRKMAEVKFTHPNIIFKVKEVPDKFKSTPKILN
jgi:hypothetical protein